MIDDYAVNFLQTQNAKINMITKNQLQLNMETLII